MTKILQSWTANRGYPLLTIMRDFNTKKVKIVQVSLRIYEYFFLITQNKCTACSTQNISSILQKPYEHTTTKSSSDLIWAVPITYTTKSSPVFTKIKPSLWSTDASEIELPKTVEKEEWVLCNLQYSG